MQGPTKLEERAAHIKGDYEWSRKKGSMLCGRNNGLGYYFVGYDLNLNAGPTGIYLRFETKDGGFF